MDNILKNYNNLSVLILSGNFIATIPGKYLPKSLKFLELFANHITDIRSLVQKSQFDIYHLGLGRNRLSNSK